MLVSNGDYLDSEGTGRLLVSATLRIVRPPRDGFITLLDVESTDCWDDRSPRRFGPNPSPGVRIMLRYDGELLIDRKKIGLGDLRLFTMPSLVDSPSSWGTGIQFLWAITAVTYSFGFDTDRGVMWISETTPMVPLVEVIREATGIQDFQFLRVPVYDRIQIGVTANASSGPVEVVVGSLAIESHE